MRGTTYHELYNHLYEKKYLTLNELNEIKGNKAGNEATKEKHGQINRLFEESFPAYLNDGYRLARLMSMDSYFNLIEYIGIVEARENAASAKLYSFIAIGLAAITLVGSMVVAFMQSQQSLMLNEKQFKILASQKYNDSKLISKIVRMTDAQHQSINLYREIKDEVKILKNKLESKNMPNKLIQGTFKPVAPFAKERKSPASFESP
mgnify:CR=1 FL=1